MVFNDRFEAGRRIADILYPAYKYQHVKVIALPNGGVQVGFEIAKRFSVPLEVVVSLKLPILNNQQFGLGAIAEEGVVILNDSVASMFGVSEEKLWESLQQGRRNLNKKIKLFRKDRSITDISSSMVIVVDDGLANSHIAQAALTMIEHHCPPLLLFAAPVCELDTSLKIGQMVDDIVCLNNSQEIQAVGIWYRDYEPVSDQQVVSLLRESYSNANAERNVSM